MGHETRSQVAGMAFKIPVVDMSVKSFPFEFIMEDDAWPR